MAAEFKTFIGLPPIPADARGTALQTAALLHRAQTLGSVDALRAELLDRILSAVASEPESEQKRLRLLYQHAYTRAELQQFIAVTCTQLGIE